MSKLSGSAKELYDLLNSIDATNSDGVFTPAPIIKKTRDSILKDFKAQVFVETEGEGTPISYKRTAEKSIEYYITTGNVPKILAFIESFDPNVNHYNPGEFIDIGEVSENPLLQAFSMFVSGITLYTRAAIAGGLPEHIAYALSDNYIKHALNIKDTVSLNRLQDCSLYDFTSQVHEYKYRKYGLHLRRCLEYISRHLHDKISLDDLSKVTGKSSSYISKLFVDELGMRPTVYIRKEKLEYARNALELTDFSVSALSDLLAFPSTSAFISYFKNEYGCTPLEYKNTKKGGLD